MKPKPGFYWIRLRTVLTVGEYDDTWPARPWSIVGSDEAFSEDEITVVEEIQKPVTESTE